jgi:hypothetical protein
MTFSTELDLWNRKDKTPHFYEILEDSKIFLGAKNIFMFHFNNRNRNYDLL